jgi:intraflagellar transport protein 81
VVDVLGTMEAEMAVDVREEIKETLVPRVVNFLRILKFPNMPRVDDEAEVERMNKGIGDGDKNYVYPILQWALQDFAKLSKRAYLAKYLVPEQIPQEFMQDEVLVEIHTSHKELQMQFKEVHKRVEKLRNEPTRPGEIKGEITTLEDERKQLSLKIERLRKQTDGEPGFAALLEATSALRQQQDEDSRLNENQRKQIMTLQHVRQRHEEMSKRLQQLKRSQSANSSAEDMMRQLAEEVKELQHRVNVVMPRELEQETFKLQKLQEQMYEPHRSKEDVEQMQGEVEGLEGRCRQLRQQIDDEVGSRFDNKLAMFRQTALVAAKKLASKEDELEALEQNHARIKEEVEEKEARLSEVSGPKHMTREEFKAYGNTLREKTHTYKKMKMELGELRNELVLLGRTEQILRGRDRNLEDFLQNLEMKKGIVGYRETQQKLERASEITSSVDANKEQTLEQISGIVQEINNQLKDRKTHLAPQIKRLREVRKEYQEVETEYNRKRQMYDKVAVGLEVERQQIEQEADALQGDCLREESNYHYFQNLTSIAQANLDRVRNEEKWSRGEGKLLPNFDTYAALYKDKEARQKALKEQLQRQKVRACFFSMFVLNVSDPLGSFCF